MNRSSRVEKEMNNLIWIYSFLNFFMIFFVNVREEEDVQVEEEEDGKKADKTTKMYREKRKWCWNARGAVNAGRLNDARNENDNQGKEKSKI